MNTPDDADHGYIAEVDLKYPTLLHKQHSEYPLAPEKLKISSLSPYQKEMLRTQYQAANPKWCESAINAKIDHYESTPKLVRNLRDKTKYILHYRLLKKYVALGLEIGAIHRVLKFRQSAWLKPFIEFNTKMRAAATSEFGKDFSNCLTIRFLGKRWNM